MANQRSTFSKRQRELGLKDKAAAKQARRAAKRTESRDGKGPPIAWDEAVHDVSTTDGAPADPGQRVGAGPTPDDDAPTAADDVRDADAPVPARPRSPA